MDSAGADNVAIGSDMDGALKMLIDVEGLPALADALLESGLDESMVAGVMGGNAVALLRAAVLCGWGVAAVAANPTVSAVPPVVPHYENLPARHHELLRVVEGQSRITEVGIGLVDLRPVDDGAAPSHQHPVAGQPQYALFIRASALSAR